MDDNGREGLKPLCGVIDEKASQLRPGFLVIPHHAEAGKVNMPAVIVSPDSFERYRRSVGGIIYCFLSLVGSAR